MASRSISGKLLLVDDDAALREALGEFLDREGFAVFEACDGEQAFRLMRSRPIDCSVMDVHMPGMTGPEVLRRLLKEQGLPAIPPTILMSSDKTAAEVLPSFFGAPVQFAPKPIRLDALRRSLERMLRAGPDS